MKGFLNKVQGKATKGETPVSTEGKVARSDVTLPRGKDRRYAAENSVWFRVIMQ